MAIDAPYFHADRPQYAEVYQDSTKPLSVGNGPGRLNKNDKREDNAPPPPASNFSPPTAAIVSNVSFSVHTALAGKVSFDNLPPLPRTGRQIPSSQPRRAEQTQTSDHDALRKEAHRLALEIRKHREHKLLIEAGLVEADDGAVEQIEEQIAENESRLREIAGASPIVSAAVRKKALPLTEISEEYVPVAKLLAKKRALEEKSYRSQSDRQKRNIEKQIGHVDAELAVVFASILQDQETGESENDHENGHERDKRLSKTARLMEETRRSLRLVSRKWERIDASHEASVLRHTLRDLSTEREALLKGERVRTASLKKETDRREVKRRQKACPEYWEDRDGTAPVLTYDKAEEERDIARFDEALMAAEREDYEAEYQDELRDYEDEEAQRVADYAQSLEDAVDFDPYDDEEEEDEAAAAEG